VEYHLFEIFVKQTTTAAGQDLFALLDAFRK
jgi:hypothetical protein